LEQAGVFIRPDESILDSLSQADLDERRDQVSRRKVELIEEYARNNQNNKPLQINLRFFVSPEIILEDMNRRVKGIRLTKNLLTKTDAGTLRPIKTDQFEEIPVGLVFHSIGYRGVPLTGIPFNDRWGVIPNKKGRIINQDSGENITGIYTAGWIKRGPSGVIGTNKLDASETVSCMFEDLKNGRILNPTLTDSRSIEAVIRDRQPEYVLFNDWLKLDQIEIERGREKDRPRVKFTEVDEMLSEIGN